jgi:hypothetical protein
MLSGHYMQRDYPNQGGTGLRCVEGGLVAAPPAQRVGSPLPSRTVDPRARCLTFAEM